MILWETATRKERRQFPNCRQGQLRDPAKSQRLDQSGFPIPDSKNGDPVEFAPDSRMLARGTEDGSVMLWDVIAGKELLRCKGHAGPVACLAFSPDGKILASGGNDGLVLLWDVPALRPSDPMRIEQPLAEGELARLWADLGSEDAAQAYQAILTLAAARNQSVPFLVDRYLPTRTKDVRMARALKDLDHENFAVREKAALELGNLDELAEPAMRQLLKRPPSQEVRRRLEQLLDPFDEAGKAMRRLRRLRAAEVLEAAGTDDARQLLEVVEGRQKR